MEPDPAHLWIRGIKIKTAHALTTAEYSNKLTVRVQTYSCVRCL